MPQDNLITKDHFMRALMKALHGSIVLNPSPAFVVSKSCTVDENGTTREVTMTHQNRRQVVARVTYHVDGDFKIFIPKDNRHLAGWLTPAERT